MSRITAEMPCESGPCLRARRPGARPVRDIAHMGDDVGTAGAAGTAPPHISPAVAGRGPAGPGSPGPLAAAGAVAAQRMDPGLSQPRPGRAGYRHRRSARAGPRDGAGAGGPGSETLPDAALRGTRARSGLAASG